MSVNFPARTAAHPPSNLPEGAMRNLPVQLPPMTLERRGGRVREIFNFLLAFGAMFGAAMLGLDLLA